jgi:predicted nucleic acid-binding protein
MSKRNEPNILLDSDVVRHFLNGNRIHQLSAIFPNRFVMLDIVKEELCRSKGLLTPVTNFLSMFKIEVVAFPLKTEIIKEYAVLKRKFGDGESACMAVARFKHEYIASSNLKDIKYYCREHGIIYYTTMDLLVEAMKKNILTETECDQFIKDVKSKGSKLPCNTMKEYSLMKPE